MLNNHINKILSKDLKNLSMNHKEVRPKSTKIKFNENNNIINTIKASNLYAPNLRYSFDKKKIFKNESKLTKILLSNDSKLKIHYPYTRQIQENELNKNLFEDKLNLQNLEDKIKKQKEKIEEKKNKIKKIKQNNEKLTKSIKEKENNIETIKKSINDYKQLNEEIINKINNINISQNDNELSDSYMNNSNDFNFNFDNLRDREEGMNYLLSMMGDLPNQPYPNVDNMTYEELLELEERMGKVSNGLSDDEIKKLKQEKFIKYKYLEDKCIICQFDFKELERIVVLPCKHCFHFQCIKPWIEKQHYCPLCKKNIREGEK